MRKHGLIQKIIIITLCCLVVIQILSAKSNYTQIHSLPDFSVSATVEDVTPNEIHDWLNSMDNEKFIGCLLIDNDLGTEVINNMLYGIEWTWFDYLLKPVVENIYLTQKVQRAIIQHDEDEFLVFGKMIKEDKELIKII